MGNMMYTPLENVFAATMEREGKIVTAWSSGKTFQAFFRRCDDGQSTEDRITVYYGVDAPVEQGSLIQYGRKIYILMNKETEENTCYYKSYGIATNGLLNTNNRTIKDTPFYGYDLKDGLAYVGNIFSVINGNMELVTEITEAIQLLKVNDTFNTYGRTFQVDNIYLKDGLFHIIAEVTVDKEPEPEQKESTNATIEASSDDIRIGGTYKTLTVHIYDDDKNDITDKYESCKFKWSYNIEDGENDNVLCKKGDKFNSWKISLKQDWSLIEKTLEVRCEITSHFYSVENKILVTKKFKITAT